MIFNRLNKSIVVSVLLLFIVVPIQLRAQNSSERFRLTVKPVNYPELKGLQSYIYAQWGDEVLILGGRLDGLHRRQPFASFDADFNNRNIWLINLHTKKTISQPINTLSTALQEQLESSNMQCYQKDSLLIVTGGYGYSKTKDEHVTYPYLTIIQIPQLIQAIHQKQNINACFSQIKDERMAITGGRMHLLEDSVFYLVGGHRFDGSYNPMGPDHGPGFTQQYSNSIRRFTLQQIQAQYLIQMKSIWYDSLNLHRRDMNVLPFIDSVGAAALTLFSGVFQYDADIPYHTLVDIRPSGYHLIKGFEQRYNQYQTASFTLFDSSTYSNYSVFFGGIGHYYMQNKKLIKDNDVPFTKHISVVQRNKDGRLKEYLLPNEMPGYLGASAEFLPANLSLLHTSGVLMLNRITDFNQPIGYIIGGIQSTKRNIFWDNEGELSKASPVIFEVFLSVPRK
jgi:hypothetical protein